MARRTVEDKRSTDELEALPLEQPRRSLVPFWGVAATVVIVVAGIWAFALTRSSPKAVKPPAVTTSSAPTGNAPATVAPGVAATTIEAFAALPVAQKTAIMQEVLSHSDDVLNQAYSTLNPDLLPLVLTGAELQVQQQQLQSLIQRNQPESETSKFTILSVATFPQFGFVSVDSQGTGTGYVLNPATHQPTGPPTITSGRRSHTIVIEDGVWKLKESIQEQPTP